MAKTKAVLDQETWTAVDIPDEFQAIVKSLLASEAMINGDPADAHGSTGTTSSEVSSKNDGSLVVDVALSPHPTGKNSSIETSAENSSIETSAENNGEIKSPPSTGGNQENRAEVLTSSTRNENNTIKENARAASQTLIHRDVGYHMVNCGLIRLKMLSEYIHMNNFLPALSFEIVQRVVELLKFFNTRTFQLVLGAGALQVSGLKSITSKHLALASQVISMPLFLDYKVQIMRERLLVHLSWVAPKIFEGWNRPEDNDSQPSQFARSLTKGSWVSSTCLV